MKESRNLIEIITDMGDAQELSNHMYLRDYEKYKFKCDRTITPDDCLYLSCQKLDDYKNTDLFNLTLQDLVNLQHIIYYGRNLVSCQLYVGKMDILIPYRPSIYELIDMKWEIISDGEVMSQRSDYVVYLM